MNEQIEKLMRESGMSFTSQTERIVSREEALKFAELIVRECAGMAQAFHTSEYDFTGDLELHEFMLEHFGVDE
jgi:hypothetical protein